MSSPVSATPLRRWIVCFDFDGTLCDDAFPAIGAPRHEYLALLATFRDLGAYLIINSARSTLDYDAVAAFLATHHAPYDQLALGVKPIADLYIDDHGWLPDPHTLLMLAEHRHASSPMAYYQALASNSLVSPFARNIAAVPEAHLPHFSEHDPQFAVILPVSGGMDSFTLYQMAVESGVPYHLLYFDFGQPYAAAEQATLAALIPEPVTIITYPVAFTYFAHILSGRNALILLLCADYARSHHLWGEVWFGALAGESPTRGGDKSRRFLNDIQHLLALADLRAVTPLIGFDKPDLVRYWRDRHQLDRLRATKSCFHPTLHQCGHCQSCFRKYVAFAAAGEDPLPCFPLGFDFTPFHAKYRAALTTARDARDFAHYSPARIASTLAVLDSLDSTNFTSLKETYLP